MDIGGTAKKIQRATKVAEETYKKMQMMLEKMQEMMEKMQQLQADMEVTSQQVDHIEYDLAEQRVLLEALLEAEGIDVEKELEAATLPEPPGSDADQSEPSEKAELAKKATSRPSANETGERSPDDA